MTKKKTIYYKAVRTDGTDFRTHKLDYTTGEPVMHHAPIKGSSDARNYLSVSTVLGDFPGASWPWRILEVEAVGDTWKPGDEYRNKVAVAGLRMVRELRPWAGFGPQGEQVDALVTGIKGLEVGQIRSLGAARDAAPRMI